jgi:hypothetical protein
MIEGDKVRRIVQHGLDGEVVVLRGGGDVLPQLKTYLQLICKPN